MDEDGLNAARVDAESASDSDGDVESSTDERDSETREPTADAESDDPAGTDAEGDANSSDDVASDDDRADDVEGASTDTRESVDADAASTVGQTVEGHDAVDSDAASDDGGAMPGVPDPEPEERDVPEDVDESKDSSARQAVPDDVQKYARFKKMDGAQYDRVNEFLRDRTYITAREWAIARLCSDFRTETGVEMTKIGENLPELVPFMTDTYTPQAVNQARSSFEEKVRKAGATFLYGAMCDFFTAEELDDVMYESTEVAKFLLEVEGVDLSVEEELEAEERISSVMREVREASEELRERDDE